MSVPGSPPEAAVLRPALLVLAGALAAAVANAADCDLAAARRSFESKCGICHVAMAGAATTVGPNLHGVVGRGIGRSEGFAYSEALRSAGGTWTEDRLDSFLISPQTAFPGTAMPFQGLKSATERQRLICFLSSLK
jgi:cytochrome c